MTIRRSWLFPALAAALLSCAPAQTGKVARGKPLQRSPSPFPAAKRLTEIAEKPVPVQEAVELIADTETWTLAGPLPDAVDTAPRKGTGPWDAAFAEAVARERSLRATESMHCVARELGRYQLAKSGRPPQDLQRFILGRCGAAGDDVRHLSSTNEIPDSVTDAEAAESAKDTLAQAVADLGAAGEALDVGLWFGREKGRAIILFAATGRVVDLEPIPMAVSKGKVTVKGTLRVPAATLLARVNRGRFESKECTPDDWVLLPDFSFSCAVDPADALARIEVFSYPPERILGHSIAGILVAPSGKTLTGTFQRFVPKTPTDPKAALADGFLAALNGVRREAGLLDVRATEAQTAMAHRVAPHYFAGEEARTKEARDAVADVVALGMLAGWSVDGTVHNGMLASAWTSDTGDPARLLASMLESPSGRAVLLDVDADVIAIGAVQQPDRHFLGALVTVYRLFEYVQPDARIRTVLARMDVLRAEKGQPETTFIKGLAAETDAAMNAVEKDHLDPAIALDRLLQGASVKARKSMRGYVIEARTLDDFRLPADYTEAAFLPVAVAVAYHRPEGEPWGRWVIMVATFASEPA